MKWKKNDIADKNYLNIMKNTNEPSQQRSETNQLEDLINPELNKEIPEDGFGEPPENPEDELHKDLNQLRMLSDELKNTRNPLGFPFPHRYKT